MRSEEIWDNPAVLFLVPDSFKMEEMCIKAVEVDPLDLYYISNHFKTQEICNNAVREVPSYLQHVPDWFVTQEQIKIWHYDDDYYDDDKLIEWYEVYQKRKAQTAKIKEEILFIAWYTDPVMDWAYQKIKKEDPGKYWPLILKIFDN